MHDEQHVGLDGGDDDDDFQNAVAPPPPPVSIPWPRVQSATSWPVSATLGPRLCGYVASVADDQAVLTQGALRGQSRCRLGRGR